ncbi:HEPN domain-containing protein, partial [Patescibacteria group bacterium]|nr:HEPN domain-containing protein [Patescibacteria group bacterium]
PPKTHQLIRLAGICKGLKLNLDNFLPKLAILSEYYFESRYPNSLNKELDNKEIAEHALESAKKIVKKVLEYFDDKQKGGGYG